MIERSHTITYYDKASGVWSGRCTCGWTPTDLNLRSKSAVEFEYVRHMQNVERARTGLSRGQSSLKAQRDYYLTMADDSSIETGQRRLWRLLADELTVRLNDRGESGGEQLSLL